jgi:cobalt-zinc-cadmium efflux system outer membrane protein
MCGLLGSTALVPPAWAAEPHGSDAHKYEESIYNSGPVVTLEGAVKKALDSSPRLKSVAAGVDAAKGAEDQAGAWPNPEFGFEAENVAGGGQFSGTNSAEYTYGLTQRLEIGGKRSARKSVAQAVRESAQTRILAERLNLERDIHIAYSNVLAEAEALKLAIDQEKLAMGVLATVSKRVDAAAEPEIQRSKAKVAYTTSVIARQQEERQLKVSKEKLARLWGASKLDVSLDHAHFFELRAPNAFHTYREKLNGIPDMQRLSYVKAEKESLLDLERAQAIPDPNFSLGVRDFRDSGDQALLFGVSFPIPVFNQNSGNISKARAEVTQAESDGRQAELMLEQELTENWQEWNSAFSEAEQMQTTLLPAAEKAFRLARSGYEKGKFPYLEVLDAQRTLFNARAQYHNSLKRYHSARANVERLTAITGDQ